MGGWRIVCLPIMIKGFLSTYDASLKYKISARQLRHLLFEKKAIQGEAISVSKEKVLWLIKEPSLKAYLKHRPKPGPKPKK